jgi:DNA polymerase-4/DNA polymerase V
LYAVFVQISDNPLTLASYPRAILHVDADAFFTSVEQALEPALRGRPVVTGKERGIIACASYEAKALGIQRGLPLFEARRLCPQLVVLPSDYETYGLYSRRMFDIMRRYTPAVEEYSVDEAFLDLTGVRRVLRASYEEIARRLQADIASELGLTVSAGLSPTKCLAKLCSKFRKPAGFTAVPGRLIHVLLARTPLEKVWGFGPSSVALLQKYGLRTALDFVLRPEAWARRLLHKPGAEIWHELRGRSLLPVTDAAPGPRFSIVKSQTFAPPSGEREYVFARLMRNAEAAFARARRHRLRVRRLGVVLRRQDYEHSGMEARLTRPSASAQEAAPLLRRLFDAAFDPGARYRSTLVALGGLENEAAEQLDLFDNRLEIERMERLTRAVDEINGRLGRNAVCSGAALFLRGKAWNPRDDLPARRAAAPAAADGRRRLAVPCWNLAV